MKTLSASLTTAALLLSGSMALAQMQYNSVGPLPSAPNQTASPNSAKPVAPNTGGVSRTDDAKANTGSSTTTGSGASNGGVNGPVNNGISTPTNPSAPVTSNTGVATPSGLTND
jgi:hypothetical protein